MQKMRMTEGFGLIGVMISLALLSMVSMAMLRLIKSSSSSLQALNVASSRRHIVDYLQLALNDREGVALSLRDKRNSGLIEQLESDCGLSPRSGPLYLLNTRGRLVSRQFYAANLKTRVRKGEHHFAVHVNWECLADGDLEAVVVFSYRDVNLPGLKKGNGKMEVRLPMSQSLWKVPKSTEEENLNAYLEFFSTGNFMAMGGDVEVELVLLSKNGDFTHEFELCGESVTVSETAITSPRSVLKFTMTKNQRCSGILSYSDGGGSETTGSHDLRSWRTHVSKAGLGFWRIYVEDSDDYDWNDSVWMVTSQPAGT